MYKKSQYVFKFGMWRFMECIKEKIQVCFRIWYATLYGMYQKSQYVLEFGMQRFIECINNPSLFSNLAGGILRNV